MGFQLWIHQDVRKWLASLQDSEPEFARMAGEAVLALAEAGEVLDPPLAISLPSLGPPDNPWLDPGDRRHEEARQRGRRELANVATLRKRLELLASQLDRQLSDLASRRDEAFRAGRADQASEEQAREASVREKLREVQHKLLPLASEEAELKASERSQAGRERPWGREQAVSALMLCPGAPDNVRAGLLCVVQRPDRAALLTPVSDTGMSPFDYQAVIRRRLAQVYLHAEQPGSGGDSAAAGFATYDAQSFAEEFFPGQRTELALGARALLARYRAFTLAAARQWAGLSQAQVAARMSVRQERISAIERAEPGAVEVRTLASYAGALGGRLEIIAHINDERITLASHA
ncbi:MAG TPA: XRE family transcriptional regulator [Streptosporangiaceae bacterium]|nr:XRE family transcriptional regulator [Streptosporangiaceae bacterium]